MNEAEWLAATDPRPMLDIVGRLAQAAYEQRSLPEGLLEPARLAVLADALEEAGCGDQEVLQHLRGQKEHWRGCWVLDLLLAES
jgi:hypothetical protein